MSEDRCCGTCLHANFDGEGYYCNCAESEHDNIYIEYAFVCNNWNGWE